MKKVKQAEEELVSCTHDEQHRLQNTNMLQLLNTSDIQSNTAGFILSVSDGLTPFRQQRQLRLRSDIAGLGKEKMIFISCCTENSCETENKDITEEECFQFSQTFICLHY